jgi:hypothetical protein
MDDIDERTSKATIEYLGRPVLLTHSQVKVFMSSRHSVITRDGVAHYAKSGRKLTEDELIDLQELRRKGLIDDQAGKNPSELSLAPSKEASELLEWLMGP